MVLFTHYQCMTHLSHTSLYDTYLAYPENDPNYRVVLKIFAPQYINHEDFQRMERRLQGLQHPHIVAMLELGIEQGKPYLVSAYQPGSSLREYLDQLASEHLSLDDAVAIVMQVGQATAFAHTQGVLHQEIRPENILLNDQGHALLTNFSLGDIMREPGLKNRSDRRAVSYLAPEQTVGIASPASDQYALGCLLYELVTGKSPNPISLQQHSPLAPVLPRTLETVILRALALKPQERYPGVATFLDELTQATQPEPATFPGKMESRNVPALHPALAAHAQITSLDAFSSYEQAEAVAEVVVIPPQYFEVNTASYAVTRKEDQKEDQRITHTTQDLLRNAQMGKKSAGIARISPIRKRTAGVIGAVVTLLALALVLAYSFNSGARSEVKHGPALAVSTTVGNSNTTVPATVVPSTVVPSKVVPATAKPVATRKPTVQKTNQNPASGGIPANPTPTATPKQLGIGSIRIDSGGSGAGSFVSDKDFSNPTPGRPSSASNDASNAIDTSSVQNAAPRSVYQSSRIGDCLYTIPHLTPYASYAVRLHFAETYWTRPGQRTFDVTLNARLVLHNFDILATAGGANKAVVEQFVVSTDSTGTITIRFQTVKDNAQINAIEVLAV